MLKSIKQDWRSLVLVKKETEVRNPTVSQRYPKWRIGEVTYEVKISEYVGIQRKRVNYEEELIE
jgi:hypothetical protein